MIVAGLLAGRGIYDMAEKVVQRCLDDSLIQAVWILTPFGRVRHPNFLLHEKLHHINQWIGPDSHDKTGLNREVLRSEIYKKLQQEWGANIKWVWIGDDDALPADDYFKILSQLEFDYPVLLTGKTRNMDGSRWYDWCTFGTDHQPFCIPYETWDAPRWSHDIYCSGNQHVMNRSGFNLNVPYIDRPGEDPHYCRAFKKAGGSLLFRPELSMQLLKMHPPSGCGSEAVWPKSPE